MEPTISHMLRTCTPAATGCTPACLLQPAAHMLHTRTHAAHMLHTCTHAAHTLHTCCTHEHMLHMQHTHTCYTCCTHEQMHNATMHTCYTHVRMLRTCCPHEHMLHTCTHAENVFYHRAMPQTTIITVFKQFWGY